MINLAAEGHPAAVHPLIVPLVTTLPRRPMGAAAAHVRPPLP